MSKIYVYVCIVAC